jgi:hypothetical protein
VSLAIEHTDIVEFTDQPDLFPTQEAQHGKR